MPIDPEQLREFRAADPIGQSRNPLGRKLAAQLRELLPPGADVARFAECEQWDPESQRRALDLAKSARVRPHRAFYCKEQLCDGQPHGDWAWNHARYDQHPPHPNSEWFVWLLLGGRGSGKTRTGAEFTHRMTAVAPRIALVGPTGPDIREFMVEGESGILATASPDAYPSWEPSKRRITWPNGARANTFSAEEPDRLRGPQHHFCWIDEPAHMALIDDVWDNLLLGLRLGRYPRICATTTPTPIPWTKATAGDALTVVSRVSTYANLANLAEPFRRSVLKRYEGTRLGRQELHGEILTDVEGALWTWDLIENARQISAPKQLDRVVVGIDPAGSARAGSSETGIVVVGRADEHLYILADGSGTYSPNRWATTAVHFYEHHRADALVPEKNYGGDMVTQMLRTIDSDARITPVTSRRGKALRAEPIVSLYEQGRVHHVGRFPELEDQLTSWVPDESESPDRLDALVHACTALVKVARPVQIASPAHLRLVVNR